MGKGAAGSQCLSSGRYRAVEGDVLSRSLWPCAFGKGGPGCQPPRGGVCQALGMARSSSRAGAEAGTPLLEGSRTLRAPFVWRDVPNFKSQHLSKSRGGGGRRLSHLQAPERGYGGSREGPHGCPGPWRRYHGRRQWAPGADLSPGEAGGARCPGTRAGPSCSPGGSGAHRGRMRAEWGIRWCRPRHHPLPRLPAGR